jgi:hypothetical protein
MTKGHFHAIENRAEYYWGIEGEGILLLMDKKRNTRASYYHNARPLLYNYEFFLQDFGIGYNSRTDVCI